MNDTILGKALMIGWVAGALAFVSIFAVTQSVFFSLLLAVGLGVIFGYAGFDVLVSKKKEQ